MKLERRWLLCLFVLRKSRSFGSNLFQSSIRSLDDELLRLEGEFKVKTLDSFNAQAF